jgi:mannosyltransferase OCH1-like enzyme
MRGFTCVLIYHRPVPSFVTRQWEQTNPGVVVLPYTFPQARMFIGNRYNASYVAHFDTLTPTMRSDFFRYLYLYENGGAYADVDQEQVATCNFGAEVDFVLALSPTEGSCANTFLWSRRPRHPLMINAANAMMNRPDIDSLAHLYHMTQNYTG